MRKSCSQADLEIAVKLETELGVPKQMQSRIALELLIASFHPQ